MIFPVPNRKNDHSDPLTEDSILANIGPYYHGKAKQLLAYFHENPQQLTWNSDGQVFIENESVPEANFFRLFPSLFSYKVSNNEMPGYAEFVSQIADMGLGHLVGQKMLRGFKRKFKIVNQNELYNTVKRNDKWYFLGQV